MALPTFLIFLTLILSFFTLTCAHPIINSASIVDPQPDSLLGRHYVRHSVANTPPRVVAIGNDNTALDSSTGRADRFHAVQRRLARRGHAEIIEARRGENLLSNQNPAAPVITSTQTPTPHTTAAPNTSVTLIPRPTARSRERVTKHSGGK